jgi:hypothetical protein
MPRPAFLTLGAGPEYQPDKAWKEIKIKKVN